MKNMLISISVAFVVTAIPIYLVAAFVAGGFNISEWHFGGRVLVGVCFAFFFVPIAGGLVFYNN